MYRIPRRLLVVFATLSVLWGTNLSPAQAATWTLEDPAPPETRANASFFNDVSCPTTVACVAVGISLGDDDEALAEHWNGASWVKRPVGVLPNAVYTEMLGVSCVTPSACMGVGVTADGGAARGLVERFDGGSWTARLAPADRGAENPVLRSVSCVPGQALTSCMAVGAASFPARGRTLAVATVWSAGEGWKRVPVPVPSRFGDAYLGGVSCVAFDFCLAAGVHFPGLEGNAQKAWSARWDGKVWTLVSVPSPGALLTGGLGDVSCVSTEFCAAVGTRSDGQPLVMHWNGTGWVVKSAPTDPGVTLVSVSCAARASCVAVGRTPSGAQNAHLILRLADNAWTKDVPAPVPDAEGNFLWGVSCASRTRCMAVGQTGPFGEPTLHAQRYA